MCRARARLGRDLGKLVSSETDFVGHELRDFLRQKVQAKEKSALREQGGLQIIATGRIQTYFSGAGAGAGALSAGGGGASVALREMGAGDELITRDGEDVTPQPPLPQPPLLLLMTEPQPELQLAGAELQQVAAGAQQLVCTGAQLVCTGAQLVCTGAQLVC